MTALQILDDQQTFDDKQLAALRQLGVGNASPADLAIFFHQCQRTGLDPFAKQIYMVARAGKQTIQTGIDGYRLVARRAADREGHTLGYEDTTWCGPDGAWQDVWLSDKAPSAAKVTVVRDGGRYPAVALLTEYNAGGRAWDKMPALMLAKCAEALALRKAFPLDLSGVDSAEEMAQADPAASVTAIREPDESPALAMALAAMASATTLDECREVYRQESPALNLGQKAQLSAAATARKAELQTAPAGVDVATGEIVDAEVVADPWSTPDPVIPDEGQSGKVTRRRAGAA